MKSRVRPLEAVQRLALVSWSILSQSFTPDCCIAATKIGLEVLKRWGIHGEPVVVDAAAMNGDMATALSEGRELTEDSPARVVQIDSSKEDEEGKFAGHLVIVARAEGARFVLDLSAVQLHRPEKNIIVPSAVLSPIAEGDPWSASVALAHGGVLLYESVERRPSRDRSWRTATDWTLIPKDPVHAPILREGFAKATARLIAAIEAPTAPVGGGR
jgi:hypothetical protein